METPRREARDRLPEHNRRENDRVTEGATFAQATTQGIVQCYNYQETGHYAHSCTNTHRTRQQGAAPPAPATTGATFLMAENNEKEEEDGEETMFSFNMTDESVCIEKRHLINPMFILLDSASTVNIFSNRKLFKNIRHCSPIKGLCIYTDRGTQDTHLIGDLPGFGPVWYNNGSLANILSLAVVRKTCRITMDSSQEVAMIVHKHNGSELKFTETEGGLYYYAVKPTNQKVIDYSFATTVAANKLLFTKQQIEQAEKGQRLYDMIDHGGQQRFFKIIRERELKDCPVTMDDAKNVFTIFGTNLHSIRGRPTRTKTTHVPSNQRILLPLAIIQAHKNVTLCIDYMFFDKMVFLVTTSRNLHFITIENITSKGMQSHCLPAIKNVTGLYKARSFKLDAIHANEEFKSLKQSLLEPDNVLVNIATTNEHVPENERVIRTI